MLGIFSLLLSISCNCCRICSLSIRSPRYRVTTAWERSGNRLYNTAVVQPSCCAIAFKDIRLSLTRASSKACFIRIRASFPVDDHLYRITIAWQRSGQYLCKVAVLWPRRWAICRKAGNGNGFSSSISSTASSAWLRYQVHPPFLYNIRRDTQEPWQL